jgi:hypothetical protein
MMNAKKLMSSLMNRSHLRALSSFIVISGALTLVSCTSAPKKEVLVSVRDQKIALMKEGKPVRVYQCSTSKFGIGDRHGSYATPLGKLKISQKIGHQAPQGMVFKGRRATGEVLHPDAPGRDPIVTRILRLYGTQTQNRGAYDRCIYIHGTPEERNIGRPASFGCVRMRSRDITDLFEQVEVGTQVRIEQGGMPLDVRLAGISTVQPQAPAPLPLMEAPAQAPMTAAAPSPAPASATFGPPVVAP